MQTISMQERRRAMVRRHYLAGDANGPEAVTRAVIALHATDPASLYLSVLARSAASTLADVAQAMYDRRSLVRWMSQRRHYHPRNPHTPRTLDHPRPLVAVQLAVRHSERTADETRGLTGIGSALYHLIAQG